MQNRLGSKWLGAASALTLLASACGTSSAKPSSSTTNGAKATIVVGSKNFTEQILFGNMTLDVLKAAGYPVKNDLGLGSTTIARGALLSGQINMYWEYTGTALVDFFHITKTITSPHKVWEVVKAADAKNHLTWLNPTPLNDTYTLMMRKSQANRLHIHTISELGKYVTAHPTALKFGSGNEFAVRPDGIGGVEKKYSFKFPSGEVVVMSSGLVYQALKDNQVQVGVGFSTDGEIKALGLTNLVDNKHFFPIYNAAPVVRNSVLKSDPGIKPILNNLSAKLTTASMIHLSYEVDIQHKSVQTVAHNWLVQQGLLK
jgi:osmoprotectant transport system substrate-binding protein